MAAEKPLLLYAATSSEGHMTPTLQIVGDLVSRGYEVGVISSGNWRESIEQRGARFFPTLGVIENLLVLSKSYPHAYAPFLGLETDLHENQMLRARGECFFIEAMPSSLESVRSALMTIKREQPNREIILLADTCCAGVLPIRLGATVPGFEKPIKTIGISVIMPHWTSPEHPPPFSGLAFDASEPGHARNELAASAIAVPKLEEDLQNMLRRCGVLAPFDTFLRPYKTKNAYHAIQDNFYICHHTTLQMCIPSVEYPTPANWPPHCKFAGFVPAKPLPKDLVFPEWFDEVRSNSRRDSKSLSGASRKRIVVVAQGTLVTDYGVLVIPTIQALAGNTDVLVLAILCIRGATLEIPGGLPANARVIDYFPYDAVLPHADIFVTNSGYGGLTSAVANAVPVVQTGISEDKMDIGRRVEYTGLGVYVRPVTADSIGTAIRRVLGDDRFVERALQLKEEADLTDALQNVENEIIALST